MYQPPLADMLFVLDRVAGLPAVARLPGFDEAVHEMAKLNWRAITFHLRWGTSLAVKCSRRSIGT